MSLIELCERGLVPDALTRYGIRRLCAQRLAEEGRDAPELARRRQERLRPLRVAGLLLAQPLRAQAADAVARERVGHQAAFAKFDQ